MMTLTAVSIFIEFVQESINHDAFKLDFLIAGNEVGLNITPEL